MDVARDLYEALATGDAARLAGLLHEDFEGRTTEGLPLELGGVHRGAEAMRRRFWGRIAKHYEARAVADRLLPIDEDQLLVLGRYVGRARATGAPLDAAFAHLLHFADGRIVTLEQYTDSARWAEALAPVTPPAAGATTIQSPVRPAGSQVIERSEVSGRDRRTLTGVEFDLTDGLARITLNRPEARNALDYAMAADLHEASMRCAEAEGLRAVLINAAGTAFTVGGDIGVFAGAGDGGRGALLGGMAALFHEALERLLRLDAPIVCAVQGAAAGGGLGLLYCADLVLAADDARFALGFSALGLTSDGGNSYFLPRLVGRRRAAELYLDNRVLNAADAADWGLVTRVIPAGELQSEAFAVARRLAAGPTRAYGEQRRLLRTSWDHSAADQFHAEEQVMRRVADTADAAEGISAFIEQREAKFQGR